MKKRRSLEQRLADLQALVDTRKKKEEIRARIAADRKALKNLGKRK